MAKTIKKIEELKAVLKTTLIGSDQVTGEMDKARTLLESLTEKRTKAYKLALTTMATIGVDPEAKGGLTDWLRDELFIDGWPHREGKDGEMIPLGIQKAKDEHDFQGARIIYNFNSWHKRTHKGYAELTEDQIKAAKEERQAKLAAKKAKKSDKGRTVTFNPENAESEFSLILAYLTDKGLTIAAKHMANMMKAHAAGK